jgi:hypothetical protein
VGLGQLSLVHEEPSDIFRTQWTRIILFNLLEQMESTSHDYKRGASKLSVDKDPQLDGDIVQFSDELFGFWVSSMVPRKSPSQLIKSEGLVEQLAFPFDSTKKDVTI